MSRHSDAFNVVVLCLGVACVIIGGNLGGSASRTQREGRRGMDSLAKSERFRAATLFTARICLGAATQYECEFMRDYLAMDLDGCEIPGPIMTRPNPSTADIREAVA